MSVPLLLLALLATGCSPSDGPDDSAPDDDTDGPADSQDDGCTHVDDAVPYTFQANVVVGADDLGSSGAAIMVAVDEAAGAGLVVALRFDLPFYSGGFAPGCDVEATAADYAWGAAHPALDIAAERWPWLAPAFTDTPGIRGLDDGLAGLLLRRVGKEGTTVRTFVAADGAIQLTRFDGKREVVEGSLVLAEVSEAGSGATELAGGEHLRLDDLYFDYHYIP